MSELEGLGCTMSRGSMTSYQDGREKKEAFSQRQQATDRFRAMTSPSYHMGSKQRHRRHAVRG
jgi:ribosomal protein L20A (L18A)